MVVGATGSLGHSVVKALKEEVREVRILVRNKSKAQKYFKDFPDVEIVQGNAGSLESVENALEDCSFLYYLVNIPYPQWEEKARGLLNISLRAASRKNVKFIFPGNVYNYGYARYNPVNEIHPWAAHTKKGKIRIEMENMIRQERKERGLTYTVVRMPDFYGPWVINSFSEKFYKQALKGGTLQWFGDLDVPTEFIFSEDCGKALVTAGISEKANNKEFNVPGYSPITARKYLNEIAAQTGHKSKIKAVNSDWMISVAGWFNPLAREFKEMMYLKTTELILNGSRYRDTLGPIPARPYEEGIRTTLNWAKKFYHL